MYKALWSEQEMALGACYGFEFSAEQNQSCCTCNIKKTARQALMNFINLSFRALVESPMRTTEKVQIYNEIDGMYGAMSSARDQICSKLEYWPKFYEHQKEGVIDSLGRLCNLLAFEQGLGKAQPNFNDVLTPNGYRPMGSLKVGDKIIGSDGKPHDILQVHPQGEIDYYQVNFSDGTQTRCCINHLWKVSNKDNNYLGKGYEVKPLKELIGDLMYNDQKHYKWFVPKVKPVEFPEKELPLDPYLMGLMLGDGCVVNTASFSTKDIKDFIPVIQKLIPEGFIIKKQKGENYTWNISPENPKRGKKSEFLSIFKKLGLFKCRSHDKFIPEIYKFNSVKNRLALLQGLMDTDGHVNKKGNRFSITTVSPFLADGYKFLIQSLGGTCNIKKSIREDKRDCFYMSVVLPFDIIPFRLKRKVDRCSDKEREKRRMITDIKYISKAVSTCITVDSDDSTYLTNDFIVTHNSITSATLSRVLNLKRTLILSIPVAKWNWHEDLCVKFGYNPLYFSILDSKKSKTIMAMSPFHERFCITHYHALPKWMDYILSAKIDHIILDECTIIKNHNTAIFKNVQKIVEANPGIRISLLSGTPIKNRVDDLYAYFKLTGHQLGKNHAKFLREYANMKTGRNITKVVGAKNIDQLTVNMANFMIRKTEDECLDLPEVTYNKVMLDMEDYKEEYDKVLDELIQNKDKSPLSSSIISLNRILAMSKVKGAIELIDDLIEKGKKVVVFMSYKDPINMLEAHYGNKCVKVDGTVDHSERFVRVKKFRDDPNCTLFLGNIIAAGTSLNLTVATEVIFMNYPFTSTDIAQGVSRVKRIGQTSKMRVYFLTCRDTIDEILYDLVADKQNEINQIIDGGNGIDYEGDIKDVLYKRLLERAGSF